MGHPGEGPSDTAGDVVALSMDGPAADSLRSLPVQADDDVPDAAVVNLCCTRDEPDESLHDHDTEKQDAQQVYLPSCLVLFMTSVGSAQRHALSLICSPVTWRGGVAGLVSRCAEHELFGGGEAPRRVQHPRAALQRLRLHSCAWACYPEAPVD